MMLGKIEPSYADPLLWRLGGERGMEGSSDQWPERVLMNAPLLAAYILRRCSHYTALQPVFEPFTLTAHDPTIHHV